MEEYEKTIIPAIESIYTSFTPLEKNIADFFIHNTEQMDFSSKNISQKLFVSEASLSRFSKKCGFKGYREFIFTYKKSLNVEAPTISDNFAKQVLTTYQELLNKSYTLVDLDQMARIVNLMNSKKRVYVYGRGSSGLVASEMKLRFMRIGVNVESITDNHIMQMNSVLVDEDCVVIGITVSGNTPEVMTSLKTAKANGATTVLFTSRHDPKFHTYCDEVALFAVKAHLENGNVISPQYPILVMLDILFTLFLQTDRFRREALHDSTLNALNP